MSLKLFVVGSEDKMWADVDKDLGELLSEVDAQANEGSDDEEDLGRSISPCFMKFYNFDYNLML